MIVFRKNDRERGPGEFIQRLSLIAGELEKDPLDRERARDLLIETGEFEAAIADSLFRHEDSQNRLTRTLRTVSLLAGGVFLSALRRRVEGAGYFLMMFSRALDAVRPFRVPQRLAARIPEGYAHYGLYPEMYVKAAEDFLRDNSPARAVVIGIRSIGTSLSAAVSAVLQEAGCEVWSFTIRPRGHPFNREVIASEELKRAIGPFMAGPFLIADEGPGLSGSSFLAVVDFLLSIGIFEENMAFFPSHAGEGATFQSEEAARRWAGLKKYVAPFEEAGVLEFSAPDCMDISAGAWRGSLYGREEEYPPVNPMHEQRKYLLMDSGHGAGDNPLFLKFLGLGLYGRAKYIKSKKLAEAGFYPRTESFENGFLKREFVPGSPLAKSGISSGFLEFAADYFAFTRNNFMEEKGTSFDENIAMIRENVKDCLGPGWEKALDAVQKKFSHILEDSLTFRIDGRVFPHEWIKTGTGYIKTDSECHYDDQFFPRSQEMAWDIAAFIVEFGLDGGARRYLLDAYKKKSGDKHIEEKLPFYFIACLSYRLAYCELSSMGLGEGPDAGRFRAACRRYRPLLAESLESI